MEDGGGVFNTTLVTLDNIDHNILLDCLRDMGWDLAVEDTVLCWSILYGECL